MVQIDFSKPLTFRVEVGNAMPGGTAWHCLSQSGECGGEEVPLKDVGGLQFQTLHCTTTIEDTNAATNHTSVNYFIRSGDDIKVYPFSFTLPEGVRFVRYMIDFTFI